MHHDAASVAVRLSTCTRSARYRHGVPITVLNSISRDWPFKPRDVGAIPTEPTKMMRVGSLVTTVGFEPTSR